MAPPASLIGHPPSVLLIDDDTLVARLLGQWLAALGFAVQHRYTQDTRSDGVQDGFSLIVVDVNPNAHHGLDILRRLRRTHPQTPILALSASFSANTELRGAVMRRLRVAGVLPKPLTQQMLACAVRSLLEGEK